MISLFVLKVRAAEFCALHYNFLKKGYCDGCEYRKRPQSTSAGVSRTQWSIIEGERVSLLYRRINPTPISKLLLL